MSKRSTEVDVRLYRFEDSVCFNSPGRKAGDRLGKRAFRRSIPGLPAWAMTGCRLGNRKYRIAVWSPLLIALCPTAAFAGMPTPFTLTDVAQMRFEAISFFLMLLLVCAALVMLLWNRALRPSFPKLPRLSFLRALGLMILWGLLFVIVLTMISGARELMTPGAWEHNGATYRLKTTP